MSITSIIFGKPKDKTPEEVEKNHTKEQIKEAYVNSADAAVNKHSASALNVASTAISIARLFALALAISVGIIFWMVAHPAKPVPFAVTPNGRIIPLQPLSTPIVGEDQLLSIAQNDIIQSYTFTFANYEKQMAYLRPKFSSAAFTSFQASLAGSKTISRLQDEKLLISAVPLGAPVLIAQGILNGRLSYHIQMRVLITYSSDSKTSTQSSTKTINIVLQRANTRRYPDGVKIIQLYAAPG